jgi:hypothetical protein
MITNNKSRKIRTDHIFRMTDDTGILHHSNCGVPDVTKGYTTVDNARALIMAVKLFDQTHTKRVESLIYKYVSFLSNAQNEDGTFRNSMGHDHEFLEEKGLEECFGRCLQALCCTFSDDNMPQGIKKTVWDLIEKALPHCLKMKSSRAIAYVILGLKYLRQEQTNGYISKLAALLVDHYVHYNEGEWHWFEDRLTCCNASLPWALLTAFKVTKESRYLKVGLESLAFLESKTFTENYFKPIGMKGLLYNGNDVTQYDEQTLEASETTSMYIEAFLLTNNKDFIDKAKTCFYWYLGKNSKSHTLMDAETGGCHDGIEYGRLNPDQGAESIISFWLAYLEINKYIKSEG